MKKDKINIFLVDDDELYLKSLKIDFMALPHICIHTFATGEKCLKALDQNPDIIILDYNLNSIELNAMNGIQTLDKIKKLQKYSIPVIMLSSQDSIEIAISCMHHHAFDYVIKSETAFLRIQKLLVSIQKLKKLENQLDWYMSKI
jgi:DNA-binding NtrC family response regulator